MGKAGAAWNCWYLGAISDGTLGGLAKRALDSEISSHSEQLHKRALIFPPQEIEVL